MSFKTFISGIAQAVSKLFKNLTKVAKKSVDIAIKVVDEIKQFDAEHPEAVNLLTALIPGDADNRIAENIRAKLPEIMLKLKLVDETLELPDAQILIAGIKALQSMEGIYKNATLNSLAILITDAAADGKVTWDELALLPKWYYDNVAVEDVDTTIED